MRRQPKRSRQRERPENQGSPLPHGRGSVSRPAVREDLKQTTKASVSSPQAKKSRLDQSVAAAARCRAGACKWVGGLARTLASKAHLERARVWYGAHGSASKME